MGLSQLATSIEVICSHQKNLISRLFRLTYLSSRVKSSNDIRKYSTNYIYNDSSNTTRLQAIKDLALATKQNEAEEKV